MVLTDAEKRFFQMVHTANGLPASVILTFYASHKHEIRLLHAHPVTQDTLFHLLAEVKDTRVLVDLLAQLKPEDIRMVMIMENRHHRTPLDVAEYAKCNEAVEVFRQTLQKNTAEEEAMMGE